MSKRPKNFVIVFLLITSSFSTLQGHIVPLEWTQNDDSPSETSVLQAADHGRKPTPFKTYWPSLSKSARINHPKHNCIDAGLVETSLFRNLDVSNYISPCGVLLAEEKSPPSTHDFPYFPWSIGVVKPLFNKPIYSYSDTRRDQQKETGDEPLVGYFPDDGTVAHIIRYSGSKRDHYNKELSFRKQTQRTADGLASSRLNSKLKRAQDREEYICHFKLCQVGLSGKPLGDTMLFPPNEYDAEY